MNCDEVSFKAGVTAGIKSEIARQKFEDEKRRDAQPPAHFTERELFVWRLGYQAGWHSRDEKIDI